MLTPGVFVIIATPKTAGLFVAFIWVDVVVLQMVDGLIYQL